jgi:hypothetical protein
MATPVVATRVATWSPMIGMIVRLAVAILLVRAWEPTLHNGHVMAVLSK